MTWERQKEGWGVEYQLPTNPKEVNGGSGSACCTGMSRLELRRRTINGAPNRIEIHGYSRNDTWYRPLEMDLETAAAVHEILGLLLYQEKI